VLAIVLLAVALASALVVGGSFVARQLASSVRAETQSELLQPAAERALVESIAAWDSVSRAAQPIGSSFALPVVAAPPTNVRAWVTRLGESTYWLVAEACVGTRPMLRRRIGVVVRVSGGAATLVPGRAWGELP